MDDDTTKYVSLENKVPKATVPELTLEDRQLEAEIVEAQREVRAQIALFTLASMFFIVAISFLDKKLIGSDGPTMLTFGGVGLIVSLLTVALIKWGIKTTLGWEKQLAFFTTVFILLVGLVKIVLGPITVYSNDPLLDIDLSKGSFFGDMSNFNANPVTLGFMAIGVFAVYALAFRILSGNMLLRLKATLPWVVPDKKSKKKRNIIKFILIMGGLAALTGGAIIFIPLLLLAVGVSSIEPVSDWFSYVLTGVGGLSIAITLVCAIIYAKYALHSANEQAKAVRSVQFFMTFLWTSMALIASFHVLWAVYLFVLTTLWPFKVYTHGVAPK